MSMDYSATTERIGDKAHITVEATNKESGFSSFLNVRGVVFDPEGKQHDVRLVQTGLLPLASLLERMSTGPARIFGLAPPRVAVGAEANLVLLDLERMWRVGAQPFRSRSRNSWLHGETLTGAVVLTTAAGALVFER